MNLAETDDVEKMELKAHDDRSIPVKLFNMKVDISSILESWEKENQVILGGMIAMGALLSEQTAQNTAAAGLISPSRFEGLPKVQSKLPLFLKKW